MYQKKQTFQSVLAIIVNIAIAKAIRGMKRGNKREQIKPKRLDALNNDTSHKKQCWRNPDYFCLESSLASIHLIA